MSWSSFFPESRIRHRFIKTDKQSPVFQIQTLPVRPIEQVAEFCHRWAVQLTALPENYRQTVIAYALATSRGDENYYHMRSDLMHLPDEDNRFTHGTPREVFAEHGICGIPLVIARRCTDTPELTASALRDVQTSFNYIVKAIKQHILAEQERGGNPDLLEMARTLHGSSLTRRADNDFQVWYRRNFIPNFIGYFNIYAEFITKNN